MPAVRTDLLTKQLLSGIEIGLRPKSGPCKTDGRDEQYSARQCRRQKIFSIESARALADKVTKEVERHQSDEHSGKQITWSTPLAQDSRGTDTRQSDRTIEQPRHEKAAWWYATGREPGGKLGGPGPHLKEA